MLLKQLRDMEIIRTELTDDVTSLTADLEKERSHVHTLKKEIEMLKVRVQRW